MNWHKNPWIWFSIFIGITIVALFALNQRFPGVLSSQDNQIDLTKSLLVLGMISASLFLHRKLSFHQAFKQLSGWVGIGFFIFMAYTFRGDALQIYDRLMAELIPGAGQQTGTAMRFAVSNNGHFIVEGETNGATIRYMVDTGASDVVLSLNDAVLMGFDTETLSFNKMYNTANGIIYGAPVVLPYLRVGAITIENVRASVNANQLKGSLLGMSFLGRLTSFEVTSTSLTMHP